jgi:hypothetical protein
MPEPTTTIPEALDVTMGAFQGGTPTTLVFPRFSTRRPAVIKITASTKRAAAESVLKNVEIAMVSEKSDRFLILSRQENLVNEFPELRQRLEMLKRMFRRDCGEQLDAFTLSAIGTWIELRLRFGSL